MYINIDQVIEILDIKDKTAHVGGFATGLSIGKEEIEQILKQVEEEDISVWEASDEIEALYDELETEILKMLQEKNILVEDVSIGNIYSEEYVNLYPMFLEWKVVSKLSYPYLEMYYNAEDVAWMRKLLNMPFEAPAEERLEIYREWEKYWQMREEKMQEAKRKSL